MTLRIPSLSLSSGAAFHHQDFLITVGDGASVFIWKLSGSQGSLPSNRVPDTDMASNMASAQTVSDNKKVAPNTAGLTGGVLSQEGTISTNVDLPSTTTWLKQTSNTAGALPPGADVASELPRAAADSTTVHNATAAARPAMPLGQLPSAATDSVMAPRNLPIASPQMMQGVAPRPATGSFQDMIRGAKESASLDSPGPQPSHQCLSMVGSE